MIDILQRAARDLTLDSFMASLETIDKWKDIFGSPPLSMSSNSHHASNQSFPSVMKNQRWSPVELEPLSDLGSG